MPFDKEGLWKRGESVGGIRVADSDTELLQKPETGVSLSSVDGDTPRRFRLWLMVVAHLVLGLFFCTWSAVEGRLTIALAYLLVAPVFGFVFAQCSLLGLWAAFSPARWWMRLVGLVMGCVYFEILIRIGGQSRDHFFLLAAMATVGIAAVFRLVRWRYADLRLFSPQSFQPGQEGLKFSIRGLMLFTFIVAITIVGLREVRENVPASPNVLTVAVWSLSIVTVGLASVWAGLGLARPTQRSVVVLLMSAILGALFVYTIRQADGETYFYIVSIMVLQAGVLIASLLFVRSCGYRLVRKSMPDVESLE